MAEQALVENWKLLGTGFGFEEDRNAFWKRILVESLIVGSVPVAGTLIAWAYEYGFWCVVTVTSSFSSKLI
jgi:hypothetical protein